MTQLTRQEMMEGAGGEREKHDRESFKTHMKSSSMKRACGKHKHRRKNERERVKKKGGKGFLLHHNVCARESFDDDDKDDFVIFRH
jgi:hypothetical protein